MLFVTQKFIKKYLAKMRLIQNMSTIAECAGHEFPSNRVMKIAVIGGSGVGKTGNLMHIYNEVFTI